MPQPVFSTDDAACDLSELHDYISRHDTQGKAAYVLDQLEKAFASLAESPERGACPPELLHLGIREYREIFFKPYRMLYRVLDDGVYILLIADDRCDMQALLQRRLLEA